MVSVDHAWERRDHGHDFAVWGPSRGHALKPRWVLKQVDLSIPGCDHKHPSRPSPRTPSPGAGPTDRARSPRSEDGGAWIAACGPSVRDRGARAGRCQRATRPQTRQANADPAPWPGYISLGFPTHPTNDIPTADLWGANPEVPGVSNWVQLDDVTHDALRPVVPGPGGVRARPETQKFIRSIPR